MVVKNITVEEYVTEEFENAQRRKITWANREGCIEEKRYWEGYCDAIRWTKGRLDFFQEMWDLRRRMDNVK